MKSLLTAFSVIGIAVLLTACGTRDKTQTGKVITSTSAGNSLTVSLANSDGLLKHGKTEFTVTFADASGNPVDVGAVALTFHMPQMGSMAEMNNAATLTTSETPGIYRGDANIDAAGEWQARITYEGPRGRGQVTIPVIAR